jgi:curli biogenesis system outer membrane secretion channel CsgG
MWILLVTLMLTLTPEAWAQTKKRVAVMDFDMSAVQASSNQIFGGSSQDVGKGIADMMVTKLVQDGVYSVIERQQLAKIIGEQNFSNSDRANPDSAAKIGRVLGVDAIIIGSITQFGRDDQNHTVPAGGVFGGVTGHYGLGGVGTHKSKAVVVISARIVNTSTGEILAAVDGRGQSTRSGTSLLGGGGGGSNGGGGGWDMGGANFASTILGEATNQAVGDVSKQLEDATGKLPTVVVHISGLVADVSGNTLILNVGSKAGVKVGDHLKISRKGKEIRDPETDKVIKRLETPLGDVTITDVDESTATGTFTGATPPKVGDAAESE